MNIRTTVIYDGRLYLIRTQYDDVFNKYTTDVFRSDENGIINEKGEVHMWVTAEKETEAEKNHNNYVIRLSVYNA